MALLEVEGVSRPLRQEAVRQGKLSIIAEGVWPALSRPPRQRGHPAKRQHGLGLEPGHRVGVYVLAFPEGDAAVCTLHLEPELLVEGDAGGVSKYENAAGSFPCSYRRRRRRAVGMSDSVESAEDEFAEWHGCARVDAKVQTPGGAYVPCPAIYRRR